MFHLREAHLSGGWLSHLLLYILRDSISEADEKDSTSMQVAEDTIILNDVPEDTTVSILVPHSDTSTFQAMVCFRHFTLPFERLSFSV